MGVLNCYFLNCYYGRFGLVDGLLVAVDSVEMGPGLAVAIGNPFIQLWRLLQQACRLGSVGCGLLVVLIGLEIPGVGVDAALSGLVSKLPGLATMSLGLLVENYMGVL